MTNCVLFPPCLELTCLFVLYELVPHLSIGSAVIAGARDIPQISYWSTSKELDDVVDYPRFMRTIPSDDAVAYSISIFLKEMGYSRAAIIFSNDAYGEVA